MYVEGLEVWLRETLRSFLKVLCNSKAHFARVGEMIVWRETLCATVGQFRIKDRRKFRLTPQFGDGVAFARLVCSIRKRELLWASGAV